MPLTARGPDWLAWTALAVGTVLFVVSVVFKAGAFGVAGVLIGGAGLGMLVGRATYRKYKPSE